MSQTHRLTDSQTRRLDDPHIRGLKDLLTLIYGSISLYSLLSSTKILKYGWT